jgi:hypothetical protein
VVAGAQPLLRAGWAGTAAALTNDNKANKGNVMKVGGNVGMNSEEDGWADDMVERWFEEFDEQGDEQSREDQSSRTLGTAQS